MGTINSNGIFVYDDTESLSPLSSYMNLQGSALSTRLAQDVRFKKVANEAARTAYVNEVGIANISAANPLAVYRQNAATGLRFEVTYNGTTWDPLPSKSYLDAQIAAAQPVDTGWQSVTLNAGFTGTVSYRVRQGWVQVYGDVSGTVSGDIILAVLPAQARPTGGVLPFATYSYGGSGNNPVYADGASGNVRAPVQAGTTRRLFNGTWVAP